MYRNLKAELARINVSNKELAKKIGVSNQTISNWLNRDVEMPVSKAFLIHESLFPCLDIKYLFEEEKKQ